MIFGRVTRMTNGNIGLILDPDLTNLSPGGAELLAHWQAHCGSEGLPRRAAFDPLSLRAYLGSLLIADTAPPVGEGKQRRFRYRLIGTDVAEISGRDMSGRYFDEIYDPAALKEMQHCFGWVIDNRRPARVYGTLRHVGRAFVRFDGIFLPVSTGNAGVADQVIGYVLPEKL